MAVGEYVSVSSQRDAEQADVERERQELEGQPRAELRELAMIYVKRGLEKGLAMKVAEQLSAHDRLGAVACPRRSGQIAAGDRRAGRNEQGHPEPDRAR